MSCYVYEHDSKSYQFIEIFSNDLLIVLSEGHAAATIASALNHNMHANDLLNSGHNVTHDIASLSNNNNDTNIIDSLITLVALIRSLRLICLIRCFGFLRSIGL